MGQLIKIMGKELVPLIHNGTPVVTLKMVDELHERKPDTARKRFNDNRKRFVEGEDYFDLPYEVWSTLADQKTDGQNGGRRGNIITVTESGYMLLVKSFNDDLSWQMQRALVRCYFAVKEAKQTRAVALPQPKPRTRTMTEDRYFELIECENQVLKGIEQRAKISRDMKWQIVAYHLEGKKPAEIRDLTGVKKETVSTQIDKYKRGELK